MSNADDDIKLSYLPAQARIRLVLSKAACDKSPEPPEDMIQRAVSRLDQGVKDGSLAFYNLYRERLNLVWKRIRASKMKPDKRIAVTLAAGSPPIPEIFVIEGPAPFLASLTISASAEKISTWKFEFLKLTVQKRLQELKIDKHPDSAMLQAIFLRALRGKKISRMPLNAAPTLSKKDGDHFSVMPRGITGDLVLVINDISSVATEQARKSIIDWLERYVANASQKGSKNYLFLKDDVEGRLKSFLRGPERLSIDLPAVILAALSEPKHQPEANSGENTQTQQNAAQSSPSSTEPLKTKPTTNSATPTPAKPSNTILLDFNGNKFFSIEADENKMAAQIKIVSDAVYQDPGAITNERLESFAASKGIKFGIKPVVYDEIKLAITEKTDNKQFEFALGVWPQNPEDPYLHLSYKDPKKSGADNQSIRDRQQGNFVKKGQVIAEIAYKKPGKVGTDIYGNPVAVVAPELPAITCTANIDIKDGTVYVANIDGLPVVTDNHVALEPAYVHKGNVNLSTGNINFDGPVIISGNVEYGAMVCAKGDLEVHGVIEECIIKCGGNLTSAGIISGPKGFVKVGGSATVTFVNNASLEVKTSIEISGNVSNSKILAGKSVTTTAEDSLILGGTIEFGETMICANLGKGSGQTTTINGGIDPFLAKKLDIRSKRLDRLGAMKDEIKKSNRHLSGMKAGTTTKKHTSKRDNLKEAQQHISTLITRVQAQIDELKTKIIPYSDASIKVKATLSQNCKINICGKAVAVQGDVAAVAVSNKRVKGSFITALEEQKAESEQKSA